MNTRESPTRPELYSVPVWYQLVFQIFVLFLGIRKLHRLKLPPPKTVEARNYENDDPELFRADVNRIQWGIIELESGSDNAWNSFKDLFMTPPDCNAPVVNRRVRREIVTVDHTYYKGLDERARLSSQKKPLKLTGASLEQLQKGCVTLCR